MLLFGWKLLALNPCTKKQTKAETSDRKTFRNSATFQITCQINISEEGFFNMGNNTSQMICSNGL